VGVTIQASARLLELAPLVILHGPTYLSAFSPSQTQALAVMFIRLHGQADYIDLVFDGLFLTLTGYLILRSTFLPRALGGLVALAGLGWLTLLAPLLASPLSPGIQALGIVAEAALMLWLLAFGVRDDDRIVELERSPQRTA